MKGGYERRFVRYDGEPQHNFCLIAALDAVSRLEVPELTYALYLTQYRRLHGYRLSVHEVQAITRKALEEADSFNHSYLEFAAAQSPDQAKAILDHARKCDERLIIYVTPYHVHGFRFDQTRQAWYRGGVGCKPDTYLSNEQVLDAIHYLQQDSDPDEHNVIILSPEIYETADQIPPARRAMNTYRKRTTWLARQAYTFTGTFALIRDAFRPRR